LPVGLFGARALSIAVKRHTPNSVALTGQNPTQTSVTVSVLGSGPFTISQVGSFFSVSEAGDTAPASFTVSLTSTACLSNNSCSGSITLTPTSASGGGTPVAISVTFAAVGSGGGGGTVGAILASPASVTLNTVTGQAVSTTVSLTTSSTTPITFSFSTTPANNAAWLSVSPNSNSVSATSSATLNVYANATNITTQQTGSITITPGNGGAQTVIPVTLNVNGTGGSTYSVSPTNVSLAYPGSPQSQQIVIFSNNSAVTTFNATVTNCSSTNFLYLTGGFTSGTSIANQPVSSNLTLTLNNVSTLATGSYSCQAVVSNPINSADQVAITVTLAVNGSSGFTLSPATLSFTSATGSSNAQSSYVSVTSVQTTYTAIFTSQSSPNNTINWITLNGSTSTTITGQPVSNGMYIGLNNPQSFSAGNYSGYVTVSNPNTSGSATLSIFLAVTSSVSSGSSYTLNVNSAIFQYPSGAQSASISVSSNTQSQFIATTSVTGGAGNWLLVYQNGASGTSITGTVGSTNPLTVYLNSSAVPQQSGTYTGQVKIANPSNSNDYALVTVTLIQSVNPGGLPSATPISLSFSTPVGVAPPPQFVAVTVPRSSTAFTASLQAASGFVFVVSPCNACTYTGSQNLAVSVNPGGLGAGTYTNYISLTSNGATFATITVTLAVTGTSYTVNPTSVSLSYPTGTTSQFISISTANNPSVTMFNVQVATCSNTDFLLLNGGTQQFNQAVASGLNLTLANPGSLPTNTYTCQVVVSNPINSADHVTISVTLVVTGIGLSIITTSPLPAGTVGVPYSEALAATGGVTPYKAWVVIGGNLPGGISLTTLGGILTGLLNGVPTTPGTFTFTVQVTDNANTTATKQFSLLINPCAICISSSLSMARVWGQVHSSVCNSMAEAMWPPLLAGRKCCSTVWRPL